MANVVPTVLATTPEEFATMARRARGLSPRVHIDISDGRFADQATINVAQIDLSDKTQADLHLMVKDPALILETALSLHPSLVILHAESEGDLAAMIHNIQGLGVKAGLALLHETKVESVAELVRLVDHVLIFTGHLGHNGGKFHMEQLEKVPQLRTIKPELELSVDGGVVGENASLIAMHGIDVLYVGGYLQTASDPEAAYAALSHQAGVHV